MNSIPSQLPPFFKLRVDEVVSITAFLEPREISLFLQTHSSFWKEAREQVIQRFRIEWRRDVAKILCRFPKDEEVWRKMEQVICNAKWESIGSTKAELVKELLVFFQSHPGREMTISFRSNWFKRELLVGIASGVIVFFDPCRALEGNWEEARAIDVFARCIATPYIHVEQIFQILQQKDREITQGDTPHFDRFALARRGEFLSKVIRTYVEKFSKADFMFKQVHGLEKAFAIAQRIDHTYYKSKAFQEIYSAYPNLNRALEIAQHIPSSSIRSESFYKTAESCIGFGLLDRAWQLAEQSPLEPQKHFSEQFRVRILCQIGDALIGGGVFQKMQDIDLFSRVLRDRFHWSLLEGKKLDVGQIFKVVECIFQAFENLNQQYLETKRKEILHEVCRYYVHKIVRSVAVGPPRQRDFAKFKRFDAFLDSLEFIMPAARQRYTTYSQETIERQWREKVEDRYFTREISPWIRHEYQTNAELRELCQAQSCDCLTDLFKWVHQQTYFSYPESLFETFLLSSPEKDRARNVVSQYHHSIATRIVREFREGARRSLLYQVRVGMGYRNQFHCLDRHAKGAVFPDHSVTYRLQNWIWQYQFIGEPLSKEEELRKHVPHFEKLVVIQGN